MPSDEDWLRDIEAQEKTKAALTVKGNKAKVSDKWP